MDTDWAPEEIVRESIELIRSRGCKVTVFCTNPLNVEADELAIHPNFTNLDELEGTVRPLMDAYPEARGLRSHSLFFTERLRPIYETFGLAYDANAINYLCPHLRPSPIARKTISIPLFFMDRFHMEMADEPGRWDVASLPLEAPGLKVFDFHPTHLCLNTPDIEWYERSKAHYHDPERLRACAADGQGARTLLLDLLDWIERGGHATYTCAQIEQEYNGQEDAAGAIDRPR
jgi:hypothetical protein